MADLTALEAAVASNTTEIAAVKAAVDALKVTAAGAPSQATVDAITATVVANNTALAGIQATAAST